MSNLSPEAIEYLERVIDRKIQNAIGMTGNSKYKSKVLFTDKNDVTWIQVPGVGEKIPVDVKLVDVAEDDSVYATFEDGSVIIDGNQTSPAVTQSSFANILYNYAPELADTIVKEYAKFDYAEITNAVIDNARIKALLAEKADIDFANIAVADISTATIDSLTSKSALISTLTSELISAGYIEADEANVLEMTAAYLSATVAVIENVKAGFIDAGHIDADDIDVYDLSAQYLTAAYGYIAELTSENVSAVNLIAAAGYIADLESNNITTTDITADHATVGALDANYAHINLANVNNAWIQNGTIKNAAITNEMVHDVSANKLTAGTIDASKINVANLRAKNLIVEKLNGQPVLGGYTLVSSSSSGYSSKNPSTEGWYEYVNGAFSLSADTTVNDSKVYYKDEGGVELYDQDYIDGIEYNLNQRIDGAVETFTGSAIPSLVNYPASGWTSAQMPSHVGDIYYVTNPAIDENGYCYRFAYDNTSQTYTWVLIKDSDVTKALSDISDLQTFESETTSWIDETDEGLRTIRQNHTSLSGVVDKSVKESIQLWFTKSNTTAPGAPTSQVTNNNPTGTNSYNKWNMSVPEYNASYPNYYYCWQYKYNDNTYGWSAVIRDIAMGESQAQARKGVSDAATADGKAVAAQNAAATADGKAVAAQNAAATADGKAVAAQDTANANIKSSVQLWFSKANETAPSKPTSHVTSTSTGGNAWTTVVPVYNSSYPYYFYCYEYQNGNGGYSWSSVVNDKATAEMQSISRTAKDTADKNVKETIMLWFTKANSTAPSKPSSQVTSTSTDGNAWRVVVPTYNAAYPHYFYCYQYKSADGTYSWSDVVYDRSSTETQSTARAASSSLASYISSNDEAIESLQNQIDGAVDIWYGTADPTSSTAPWPSGDDKDIHVGDLYYNTENGHSFRYTKSGSAYSWTQIPDSDASAALAAAQDAQATADGKRRIFTTTPTVPYDIGDLWVNGSTVKYATVKKTSSQSYSASDWSLTATDDTKANGNIKSSVQLWFTKANTTPPSAPSSHVTSTSTGGNAWTTAVPAYNASYPYYFYCYEYQKGDNTYGWTSVTYDQATTESQERARTAITNAATADGKAVAAQNAAATADGKAVAAQNAAATADGKAVTAQNTANANIKSSVQLWYTSNSTTPPGKPYTDGSTSSVTSTATTANAWTLVVPPYAAATPRYHYCYQQQRGDGKYQWTTPIYDAATTESMLKAQAALPASTFTTFQTTTFKELVDEVDEQSSTITNMSERIDREADIRVADESRSITTTDAADLPLLSLEPVYGESDQSIVSWSQLNSANWTHGKGTQYTTLEGPGYDLTWTLVQWVSSYENTYISVPVTSGATYTLSCDYALNMNVTKLNNNDIFGVQALSANPGDSDPKRVVILGTIPTGYSKIDFTHGSVTFTPNVSTIYINIAGGYLKDIDANKGAQLRVRNLKLEQVPTPDAPVHIQAVKSPNLLTYTEFKAGNLGNWVKNQNAKLTAFDGYIRVQCNQTDSTPGIYCPVTLPASGPYSISVEYRRCNDTSNNFGIGIFSTTPSKIKDLKPMKVMPSGDWTKFQTTVNIDRSGPVSLYLFCNGREDADSGFDFRNIIFKYGSVCDYVPANKLAIVSSTGSKAYLDMTDPSTGDQVELYGLDNTYRDILRIDSTGHAVIYKRTAEDIYDGSESWSWDGNNYYRLPFSQSLKSTTSIVLSHYKSMYSTAGAGFISGTGNLNIRPLTTEVGTNDVSGWRTWLSSNNLIMVYPLAESAWYTIDLGYIDLPEISNGSTVYVAAELQPIISGSWWTGHGEQLGHATTTNKQLVNSVKQTTDTNSASIRQLTQTVTDNETDIESKYSSVTQSISGINTSIGSMNTAISQKADGSTVTTLSNKVNSMETTVNGTVTRLSSVESTANGVRTDLDNLELGGRNLFKDSEGLGSSWIKQNATASNGVASIPATSNDHRIYQMPASGYWSWEAQKAYVVSIEARNVSGNGLLAFSPVGAHAAGYNVSLTSEWKRYSYAFISSSSVDTGSMSFYNRGDSNSTIEVRRPKLELGNKPTDWTPAPEDIQSEVAEFKSDYAEYKQTTNEFKASVGQTYATKAQLSGYYPNVNVTSSTADKDLNNYKTTGIYHCATSMANAPMTNHGTVIVDFGVGTPYQEYHPDNQTYYYKRTYTSNTWGAWTKLDTAGNTSALSALTTRVTTAETNISSNTTAINLRATKTETYAMAESNLTPFFDSANPDGTYPNGGVGGYWQPTTDASYNRTGFTYLGEGWAHVNVSSTTHHEFVPPRVNSLVAGDKVTMLVEWRNATVTGNGANFYTRNYTAGVQLSANWYFGPLMTGESGSTTHVYTVNSTALGTAPWNGLVNVTFTCKDSSSTFEGDIRISFYKGEYVGPYKPYSGSQLYASQAELKVTNDAVSSKVEKNGVISSINQSSESVTIDANRVNIAGAAIFTSGSLSKVVTGSFIQWYSSTSKTSLSGGSWGTTQPTQTPGRYIWQRTYTTYSNNTSEYLPSSTGVCITQDPDIRVGGVNLLRNTATPIVCAVNTTSYTTYALYSTDPTSSSSYSGPMLSELGFSEGDPVTLSFDWTTEQNGSNDIRYGTFHIEFYGLKADGTSNGYTAKYGDTITMSASNNSGHYEKTVVLTSLTANTKRLVLRSDNSAVKITVSNLKFEAGTIATAWTASPEDEQLAKNDWYAECTTAAATTAKVATISPATANFVLRAGQTVKVKFSVENTGAVGSLTLAVNGTEAKSIKYLSNGAIANLPAANYLRANQIVTFTYDGTYWVADFSYNSDTTDAKNMRFYNTVTFGNQIYAQSIIGGHTDGKYYCIGNQYTFDLSYPLLWCTTAYSADQTSYNAVWTQIYDRNLGTYYTNMANGSGNQIVYLVGTISGNTFTLDGTTSNLYLKTTQPTSQTDPIKVYIPIGRLANESTGKNYFLFNPGTPPTLYAYLDGKFRQVTPTDVVATQKIYYRSSSSSAPSGAGLPTTWVTETGDKWSANNTTASNWSKKATAIANGTGSSATKYIYLYTCEQQKRLDGTVSHTPIALDSSATVIDGGNIITNSITADKIATNVLTIGNITNLQSTLDGKQASGDYATNTALTNEVNARKAHYGTCSTAATEQVKVVTCANFELVDGAEIMVKFSTANTYTTDILKLNVNSTGEKGVYAANMPASASYQLLWGKNANITFRYNGTNFHVVGEPRTWYGACSTAAGTAAKTDTTAITGVVICKGTKISLAMTNENTASSPSLNIQGTGAKYIYAGNSTSTKPTASNGLSWASGYTQEFIFDGQYYRTADSGSASRAKALSDTAATKATNYIYADSNGIKIANSSPSSAETYQYQTANGTDFYVSGAKRSTVNGDGLEVFTGSSGSEVSNAKFGTSARIGKEATEHFTLSSDGFELYNPIGEKYIQFGHASQNRTVRARFVSNGGGSSQVYGVRSRGSITYVNTYVGGTAYSSTSYTGSLTYNLTYSDSGEVTYYILTVTLTGSNGKTLPPAGSVIEIEYTVNITHTPTTTLGTRSGDVGPGSFISGQDVEASGPNSAAFGTGVVAFYDSMFAVGKYNVRSYDSLFSVGNGRSDSDRSNAFLVRSAGDVYCSSLSVGGASSIANIYGSIYNVERISMHYDTVGWVTLNSVIKYCIHHHVCYVVGDSGGQISVTKTGRNVGTLPANAKPAIFIKGACSTTTEHVGQFQIDTDGVITVWNLNSTGAYWCFTTSYPIANAMDAPS